MDKFIQELIQPFLEEDNSFKNIALIPGGFKPPTLGHFYTTLEISKRDELDEVIVLIGHGVRDGIDKEKSLKVWEIYKKYLPSKVNIKISEKPSPVGDVNSIIKNNPNNFYFPVVGVRGEQDLEDIKRFDSLKGKYDNFKPIIFDSDFKVSGTGARLSLMNGDYNDFKNFLPTEVSENDKLKIWGILTSDILNEINYNKLKVLTQKFKNAFISQKDDFRGFKSLALKYLQKQNMTDEEKEKLKRNFNDILKSSGIVITFPILGTSGTTLLGWLTNKISKGKFSTLPSKFKDELLEETTNFNKMEYYKTYYNNISPSDFDISIEGDTIKISNILKPKTILNNPNYTLIRLNENATYSDHIDYKQQIKDLTKYMLSKDMNIKPLPKVVFKHGDKENAGNFLGKTAYYNPNTKEIVLYTEGRHPKDVVRSFSHEMIHHIQNIEGRLGEITTTNTQEDDHLNQLEEEANLKGTMIFRNWTDSLNEIVKPAKEEDVDPKELEMGVEVEMEHTNSKSKAKIIALQHLSEDPKYYSKLRTLGLEEKIIGDKIQCDNCGWDWNIKDGGDDLFLCHKCYHDNTPIQEKKSKDPFGINQFIRELFEEDTLMEGRYDKISNTISSDIFKKWKSDFDNGERTKSTYENTYSTGDIEVEVDAYLTFTPNLPQKLDVDGGADNEEDWIQVRFEIDPNLLPEYWGEVSMGLKDVIRHEIEHLTQGEGSNLKPNKFIEDDILIRKIINAKLLPKSQYFKLEKEIDANLQGMYFRAKKEKVPFTDVINTYLNSQDITPQEKEEILDLWRTRLKALNLPLF